MIELGAVHRYVYNTCRVLTDPLFCLRISVPLPISLWMSRELSSCELPTFPFIDLSDAILHFVWDLYFFLLFISLLLRAHHVTEGNVDTSLDTI